MKLLARCILPIALLAACGQATEQTAPSETVLETPAAETPSETPASDEAFAKNDYTDTATWLCHPDKADDACDIDLTATLINADGTTETLTHEVAEDPAFDCFYFYPTVSLDETPNSDMTIGDEELSVIAAQFARYSSTCRLFAPLYRQITLSELRRRMAGAESAANPAMAMSDVRGSWKTYMRDHNNGRGVILVGHSQGANWILELMKQDLLESDVRDQIIAVHSIGVTAHKNGNGDSWKDLPVCASANDTGCLVNYVSFRSNVPPPETSRFGPASEEGRSICVNPTALRGTPYADAYMSTLAAGPEAGSVYGADVSTRFVKLPGLISASCTSNDTHDWLEITVNADPEDARIDDIPGDVVIAGMVQKDWGLHLIDVNLFMGDLVALAGSQADAWLAAQK